MSRSGVLCHGIRASRANKPKALSALITAERRDEGPKRGRCSFGVCQNYALPGTSWVLHCKRVQTSETR
jgi:hypothetical protein